ncbi:hypothetical protein [Phenylobacterium montanum]|uniref:HdeA/HdeB family protein n=1 Tax=Phenylobacterium montanum TaxID=2823693 RepID=A0A975ITX9_9CAUL|nr:hypothetical protein [Caulobacter sp. S6]QUD87347.1 hypothetical protein KCG34_20190 [Caulobacter sp. S6]
MRLSLIALSALAAAAGSAQAASAQAVATPVSATTETAPARAVGASLMSCRSWTANRPGIDQIEPLQRIAPMDWLYGYLSGQAAALRVDLLAGLHPSDIGAWLDVYCQAHPTDDIQTASAVLAGDLVGAAKKK